jgi:hypothetical protein
MSQQLTTPSSVEKRARQQRGAAIIAACGGNVRDLPRDGSKASLLRAAGVEQRLIGPIAR